MTFLTLSKVTNMADNASEVQHEPARRLLRRRTPAVPFFYPDWLINKDLVRHVCDALTTFGRGRLLDIGCGGRPFEDFATPSITSWVGFDVPENDLADVHGYAESLPFADASFDTVLCTEVLEHVAEPKRALCEMSRVLRDGGTLILTTPQSFCVHEAPFDFYRYTTYGLAHLLDEAAFQIIKSSPLGTSFRVAAMAANSTLYNVGERLVPTNPRFGRVLFAPLYVLNNLLAEAVSVIAPDEKSAIGNGVIASRRVR